MKEAYRDESLKPCPFCGGPAGVIREDFQEIAGGGEVVDCTEYGIGCEAGCLDMYGPATLVCEDLADARKLWNRRV